MEYHVLKPFKSTLLANLNSLYGKDASSQTIIHANDFSMIFSAESELTQARGHLDSVKASVQTERDSQCVQILITMCDNLTTCKFLMPG